MRARSSSSPGLSSLTSLATSRARQTSDADIAVPDILHHAWEGKDMPARYLATLLRGFEPRFVAAMNADPATVAEIVGARRIIWTTRPALIRRTLSAMAGSDGPFDVEQACNAPGGLRAAVTWLADTHHGRDRADAGEPALLALQKSSVYRYLARRYGHRLQVRDAASAFRMLRERWTITPPRNVPNAEEVARDLESRFFREINGPYANPAAASDLLRLVAVYLTGGHWRDGDVVEANGTRVAAPRGLLVVTARYDSLPDCEIVSNAGLAAPPHSARVAGLLLSIHRSARHADACHLTTWVSKRSNLEMRPDDARTFLLGPGLVADDLPGEMIRHSAAGRFGADAPRLHETVRISGPALYADEGLSDHPDDVFPSTYRWFSDAAPTRSDDVQDVPLSRYAAHPEILPDAARNAPPGHAGAHWHRTPHQMLFPYGLREQLDATATWHRIFPRRSARAEWP